MPPPTISSLMHRDVHCVGMDDTVADVERHLVEGHLSWAPVRDLDGAVLGVLSASDLTRFHADGRDPRAVRAWQICTWQAITVRPDATIEEVARAMIDRHVHHVVVGEDAKVLGVVSALDLVKLLAGDTGVAH